MDKNKAKKRIDELNATIYEMEKFLFIPEIINVYSKKNDTYDKFAEKGFYYGGNRYVRRSAGSGNLKQNTVTFVREDIEKELNNTLAQEVESKVIGEMVMSKLRELDQVAYIRFASVYRQFTDISNFFELLNDFATDKKNNL